MPLTAAPKVRLALGDNCPNSSDGRRWGFVREGHLVGRAFIVFWPPLAIRLIR